MPRWIVIDDTDPGIDYAGSWTPDHGSQDNLGNFGVPLLSTLHGTTSNASFSYLFKGSRVLITGTMAYTNASGPVTNPSYECFVDNNSIQVTNYSVAENRLLLCEQDELEDEVTHNISLTVHVSDQRKFWFDYIQYVPSPSVPLDNALLSIDVPDPQMQFGPGWSQGDVGYSTSTQGSTFKFDFIGVSLTWLGPYSKQLPFAATTGSYTIDDGDVTKFPLNGVLSTTTGVQYNQIFFQTPTLPAGLHTLEVTYDGDSQTTPLSLSVIYIQNDTSSTSTTFQNSTSGTSGTSTTSSTSNPTANSHTGDSNSSKHAARIGPVVGGAIGGLAFALGCIFLFTIYRRQRWLSKAPFKNSPGIHIVEPFKKPPPTIPMSPNSKFEAVSRDGDHPQWHAPNISVAGASSHITSKTLPSNRIDLVGSIPIPNATSSTGSRSARDEDSGVRLAHTSEGDIGMLPPEYARDIDSSLVFLVV